MARFTDACEALLIVLSQIVVHLNKARWITEADVIKPSLRRFEHESARFLRFAFGPGILGEP
jgi:hypothetical protein